jgi:hypothetical protein
MTTLLDEGLRSACRENNFDEAVCVVRRLVSERNAHLFSAAEIVWMRDAFCSAQEVFDAADL